MPSVLSLHVSSDLLKPAKKSEQRSLHYTKITKHTRWFTAVLIASLSHCRVQKIVFQTYIIHPLVPNPHANLSPHWRWSAANPNQAPGNALLLATSECIYHIWYINLYITYIRYIRIHTTGSTHTFALQHSFLSPQKVSFGESTSIHPLCSDRNLSTISAFQSFVSSGKPSDSIVSDPVDKGKDLCSFKRLVSCWKERTIHWSSSSNSTLSKPCVSNVANVLSWARRSWWPSHGSRFGQYDLKHMGISIPTGCNPATLEITAISLECDPTLRSSPQLTLPWHQLSWWPIRWT